MFGSAKAHRAVAVDAAEQGKALISARAFDLGGGQSYFCGEKTPPAGGKSL
jgi:hypothetical protein